MGLKMTGLLVTSVLAAVVLASCGGTEEATVEPRVRQAREGRLERRTARRHRQQEHRIEIARSERRRREAEARKLPAGCHDRYANMRPNGATLLVACGNFGDAWPLTAERGALRCEEGRIVFTSPEGREYGINGTALDAGYPRIDPIWKDAPSSEYAPKMDLGPLLDRGLELCGT